MKGGAENKKNHVEIDKKWESSTNSIRYLFISAIVTIAVISSMYVHKFYSLVISDQLISHTYQVIITADNCILQVGYLQSEAERYMHNGDEKFLNEYPAHVEKIRGVLTKLYNETESNSAQQNQVLSLKYSINKIFENIANAIEVRKTKIPDNDYMKIFNENSNQLISNIKSIQNEIVVQEYNLLNDRIKSTVSYTYTTSAFFAIGQIVAIASILIAFILLKRQLVRRIEAEDKFRSIESQMRSIIESAHDMMVAFDANNKFILFNKSYFNEFERRFNHKIQIGMSLSEALSHVPNVEKILRELWHESIKGNEYVRNITFSIDHSELVYEITSSIIKNDNNQILGAVHIVRNVTEKIQKEKELINNMQELTLKNEKVLQLLEMSDVMLACDSINELGLIISKYCGKILNFSNGIFYLMHSSKDFLESTSNWGVPHSNLNSFTQEQCWALRLGHIHHANLNENELICTHVANTSDSTYSYYCIPLRAKNDIYGLLYIELSINSKNANSNLSNNDRMIVNAFAELVALSLANVRLREHLSFQSIRDPLTSLYNRRYLEEFLSKQLHQSERTKKPIAILMLDLDHFKRINDLHGHDAGDLILKQFSQVILSEIRSGDVAARYGGEEFIVVLYDTTVANALTRAEDIRVSISTLHVKYGAQETGSITVSIGVSAFPGDGHTVSELIECADKALYLAKNSGRNKVVSFSELNNLKVIDVNEKANI